MTTTGNEFTVKEIVIELRNDVNRLIDKLDRIDRQGSIGTRQELEDHEARIRGLERVRWQAWGALIITSFILSPIVSVLAYHVWG